MKQHKVEILDCSLRDGGYYNNWDFEKDLVDTYITAMQDLPVDILEIGYRSLPQSGYLGEFFYLPNYALKEICAKNKSKRLAIMLNEKAVRIEDLDKLLPGLSPHISLIRLAIDPKNFDRGLELAKAIKSNGFGVAFNVMYMSKYAENQTFLNKISQLNGIVEYFNIVDSYGGMLPEQTSKLVRKIKDQCSVKIGFHGHNNLELAFANTLVAIDSGCDIVDATILGMGRGAGNLKTELLLTYLASNEKVSFDFNKLSEIIEIWTPLMKKYEWGTNLPYMVSGANSLPQKDVMEWVNQRYYSINSIIRALHVQKSGDKDNRLPTFSPSQTYKNVLIMGGGKNAVIHSLAVKQFIQSLENVCIIHASSKNAKSYEELSVEQIFCLVGNEGHRLVRIFNDLDSFNGKCVLSPYPRKMGTFIPELLKDDAYELEKVEYTDKFQDSHTALALQLSLELDAENIYLVGYDGYNGGNISAKEQALIYENEYSFFKIRDQVSLYSITPTNYAVTLKSVYSMIH